MNVKKINSMKKVYIKRCYIPKKKIYIVKYINKLKINNMYNYNDFFIVV